MIVESPNQRESLRRLLLRIWSHVPKRRRRQFGLLLVLMLLTSLAEVFSIAAILPFLRVITEPALLFDHPAAGPMIAFLGAEQPSDLLVPVTLAFSVAALVAGGMRMLLLWASARLSQMTGADLKVEAFARTLYQPYLVHAARNSSDVINGVNVKTQQLAAVCMSVLTIASSSVLVASIVVTLVWISPLVALGGAVCFGTLYGVIAKATRRLLRRNSEIMALKSTHVIKTLQEGLGGIRDVILDGTQTHYISQFRSVEVGVRRANASNQMLGSAPRFGIESLGMVLIAGLALLLTVDGSPAQGALATLGAMALGAQRLLPVLQQAFFAWSAIQGHRRGTEDALEYLQQPVPASALLPESELPKLLFQRDIVLDGAKFRYASDGPLVLKGLKLRIVKGERVGIIGQTGSGKSTLLDVLMGLIVLDEGTMRVDGQVVDADHQRSWQRHIAHVPQFIYLSDSTIAENIALGEPRENIDFERVRAAAEKANIAHTIMTWDKDFDTEVGERGVRLSGGQRQRIGIARALYRRAEVIVLDEATSALDTETEASVMRAIDDLGDDLTLIMVAHRLSTLSGCSRIIELANGEIVREGSYEEVVGLRQSA